MPDYTRYLRTFGEMGVVCNIAMVKANMQDQGKARMFLGYVQNHTGGTYHMLNLRTKRIALCCDVIW